MLVPKGKKARRRGLPFTYSVSGKNGGRVCLSAKRAFPFLLCRTEDLPGSPTSLCYILTVFSMRMFLTN